MEDGELVRQALNGVTKSWVVFVESIVARENLPKCDPLWDYFTQEETRRGYIQGSSSTTLEEEDVALAARGKQKFKRGEQKKDLSKVRCFACNKCEMSR